MSASLTRMVKVFRVSEEAECKAADDYKCYVLHGEELKTMYNKQTYIPSVCVFAYTHMDIRANIFVHVDLKTCMHVSS